MNAKFWKVSIAHKGPLWAWMDFVKFFPPHTHKFPLDVPVKHFWSLKA